MPKVRYYFRVVGEDETFFEDDILPRTGDLNLRAKQQVMLWNEKGEILGEPERELVRVDVIDPCLHEHDWRVYVSHKTTGGRDYVACDNCEVTGTRKPNSVVNRDPKFASNHYEQCHEPKRKVRKPTFK